MLHADEEDEDDEDEEHDGGTMTINKATVMELLQEVKSLEAKHKLKHSKKHKRHAEKN